MATQGPPACQVCGRAVGFSHEAPQKVATLHPTGPLNICDTCEEVLALLALQQIPGARRRCRQMVARLLSFSDTLYMGQWATLLDHDGLINGVIESPLGDKTIEQLLRDIAGTADVQGIMVWPAQHGGLLGMLFSDNGSAISETVTADWYPNIGRLTQSLARIAGDFAKAHAEEETNEHES